MFFSANSPLDFSSGTEIKPQQEDDMNKTLILQRIDDQGGRRRVKDRRFQVSNAPDTEKRTNWHRRNGLDQRIRNQERIRFENK